MPEPQIPSDAAAAADFLVSSALEELMRPEQVAKLFNVSPRTVTSWAWKGRLDSVRTPGGHYRFRPSVVAARLAEHRAAM